jgi:XTP/dITP diphosphohydrolase
MSGPVLHVATGNAHKLDELRQALESAFGPVDLRGLRDFPELPEPVEDGDTLEANALIKARALHRHAGGLCVADDTGLMVDALGGAPGVFSARWAGEGCSYADNVRKMCREMAAVPLDKRRARFETVLAVVEADGGETLLRGACHGVMLHTPRGSGGFGYDPVFFLPELDKTFAELTLDEKNMVSHRGRAVAELVGWLRTRGW